MRDIANQEQRLFDEWQLLTPNLVRDGVVNPDAYSASSPRVLFILKEVNAPDGGGWDLREKLAKGDRAATWNNVTRCLKGIRSLPTELSWADNLMTIGEQDRKDALKSIAAMNLKKEPGAGDAVMEEVGRATTERAQLLQRQFEIYDAEIVICCGTANIAPAAVLPSLDKDWNPTARGIWYVEFERGRFMIDYPHPNIRNYRSQLYVYGLIDAVREIWVER